MTVYLVGAGPGDPGLLTVRGADLLRRADCVVHDRLVSPGVLALVPDDTELLDVGKDPAGESTTQDEINQLLVERGRAHDVVVRLKGGDPFVFGRGGEEAEALAAAGVAFEVVPGVTSAFAAPASAGIPVTHRGLASHVTVVAGHEAEGSGGVDWSLLAGLVRGGGTLVILMGAGRAREIAAALSGAGVGGDMAVAAVRNGTWPDQETVRTTLGELAGGGVEITAPSAIVVGAVAALDFEWFGQRPLAGRRVVVTRAREQVSDLAAKLGALGAEVLEAPVIGIEPYEHLRIAELLPTGDLSTGDRAYDWIVFTSRNAVRVFFDALADHDEGPRDARALVGARVAASGPGTAAALADRGIAVDLVPDRFVAEAIVEAMPDPRASDADDSTDADQSERPKEKRRRRKAARVPVVLVPRAEQARSALVEGLAAKGYEVIVKPIYRTVAVEPPAEVLDRIRVGDVDAITFTSSSTVTNLLAALGGVPDPQPVVASMGPITSTTARNAGLRVDVEAGESTIDGLVAALVASLGPKG